MALMSWQGQPEGTWVPEPCLALGRGEGSHAPWMSPREAEPIFQREKAPAGASWLLGVVQGTGIGPVGFGAEDAPKFITFSCNGLIQS